MEAYDMNPFIPLLAASGLTEQEAADFLSIGREKPVLRDTISDWKRRNKKRVLVPIEVLNKMAALVKIIATTAQQMIADAQEATEAGDEKIKIYIPDFPNETLPSQNCYNMAIGIALAYMPPDLRKNIEFIQE